ncbi:MAG: hypothetical protein V3U65_13750 [Granulosicoccaceae bacterium]
MMDPESKRLRELAAHVQLLEAENRTLRAELNKGAAPLGESRVEEGSVNKASQSDSLRNRDDHQQGKPRLAPNLLSPEAKIRLFQNRFAGRTDIYARRWESRDGKKKGMHQFVRMNGVKGSAKNRRFDAMRVIIAPLNLLPTV